MFPRLVQTAVKVGTFCTRGTTDRTIVPATGAASPVALVFGEPTDVAAGYTKNAGVMADVAYLETHREFFVMVGAVPVTEGDRLTSDGNSLALTTTNPGDFYGAVATRSGNPGDVIPVIPIIGQIPKIS